MTKKNYWLLILLIVICIASVLLVNRDIKEYKYVFPYARDFTAESMQKGFYQLGDLITLKPGQYKIHYYGETNGKQNGFRVIDTNGNVLTEDLFPQGEFEVAADLPISGSSVQIRPGVFYEADSSGLLIKKFMIYCPNVLYREALISHAVTTFCILILFSLLILRFCFPNTWKKIIPQWIRGENEKIFLLFVLLTATSSFPMWIKDSYIIGDDFLFHLARIQGIADSLRAGYFPARIHLFTLSNYGHGSGFFYPQVWIYIPAVMRLCGYSILTCYYTFVTICAFFSIVAIYYCTYRISRNKTAGMLAAIMYAYASYRLINIYYRAALGEIQAFIFAPLIISAAYDITHDHTEKWPVLAFGFFGLLGAHLITLGIFGIVFLVILAANIRKLFQDKKIILSIIKAGICVIFTYAYFILPLIEQWQTTELAINSYLSGQSDIDAHPPYIWTDLFAVFHTWAFYNQRRHPFPGIPLLISALLPFFTLRDKRENMRFIRFLTAAAIFSLWMGTNLFPWIHFRWLLSRLQFSWRLMAIPTVLLPICGGTALTEMPLKISKKVLTLVVLLVCSALTVPFIIHVFEEHIRYTENFILEDDRLGTGEYLPVGVSKADYRDFTAKNQNSVLYKGDVIPVDNPKRSGLSFSFDFDLSGTESGGEFEIPLTYYNGYEGTFKNGDITKRIQVYQSKLGLTAVNGIDASSGSIRVWYEKTKIQKIGELISLISIAMILAAMIHTGRKKASIVQMG